MEPKVWRAGRQVAQAYARLMEVDLLPGSGLAIDQFWETLGAIETAAPLAKTPRRVKALRRAHDEALTARFVQVCGDPKDWLDHLAPLAGGSWHKAEDLRLVLPHLVVGERQRLAQPKQFLGYRTEGARSLYLLQSALGPLEITSDFLSPQADASGVDGLRLGGVDYVLLPAAAEFKARLAQIRSALERQLRGSALAPQTYHLRRGGTVQIDQKAQEIFDLGTGLEGAVEGLTGPQVESASFAILARHAAGAPLRLHRPSAQLCSVETLFELPQGTVQSYDVTQLWSQAQEALRAPHQTDLQSAPELLKS